MAEFDQALAAYRQLVVDMDGDGVPDAPLQQPMQMPQPTNAMLASAGQQQPSQGGNAMRPDQVVDRGTMVPLVEYGDGSFGPGLPGFIHSPISAVNRMLTPGYDYDNVEQASRDALDASGLAITGGIGAAAMGAYPRNSIGMIGSGRGPNWLGKMVDRFVDPQQAVRRSIKGQVDEKLRNISQMVRDGRIGPEEAARQMAAIRQQHANAVDTYSQPIAAEQPTPPDRYSNRMLQGMGQSGQQQASMPPPSAQLPQPQSQPNAAGVNLGNVGGGQVAGPQGGIPSAQAQPQIPPRNVGGRSQVKGKTAGSSRGPEAKRKRELLDEMSNGVFAPQNEIEHAYINKLRDHAQAIAEESGSPLNDILRGMNNALKKGKSGGVYSVGGVPTAPETDSRGQEHYRAPDGTFTSSPQ